MYVLMGERLLNDKYIRMKLVHSWFPSGGFCSTLCDYDRSRTGIKVSENGGCLVLEQRV